MNLIAPKIQELSFGFIKSFVEIRWLDGQHFSLGNLSDPGYPHEGKRYKQHSNFLTGCFFQRHGLKETLNISAYATM